MFTLWFWVPTSWLSFWLIYFLPSFFSLWAQVIDSSPRTWMSFQNLCQQCPESSYQMTRFIIRIKTYLPSLPLAQTFIFVSLDLLVDLFFPLLNILFSVFCSSSIICGGGGDDDDNQCLPNSHSVPEYTGYCIWINSFNPYITCEAYLSSSYR